jgi:phage tail tape measure protein, TP901 family, core region
MSQQRMKLEVLLATINQATGPLKAITKGSSETAKALKEARARLRELNDAQKNMDGFRKLDKDISITANQMKAAQQRVKELKLEMDATGKPTAAMSREFNKAVKEARSLKDRHGELIAKQQQLRTELNGSGMDTRKLAEHQRTLKTDIANATTQVERQTAALKQQSDIAARMQAARAARDKGLQTRDQIAGAGASTMAAGVAMGLPVLKAINDFREFESAMVGVAKQMDGARDANGNLTRSYYDMADAIKDMSERIPLTSVEIARLVEGAARMGIQGKENLLIFTEQAAIMASAFDLPVDQVAEDMGMMRGLYKIPIESIHELGDAINWLDDNAQSQGGDIINVMKRIAGTAGIVNMSFRDAAALGSTFLSLGASEEVAATATNAMITRLTNAPILATANRYREGLKMLNLEASTLQKNMNADATGTILDVLDRIKALPGDKQLEAATRIFGIEYGDDASKLAQNLEEYRRQLKLTKDQAAHGSMLREARARNAALDSQLEMAKSSIFNSSSELGQQLKPVLVDILGIIRDVTHAVRDWVKEHPVLAGAIIKTVAVLSILAIIIGGLLLAIAAIIGPLVIARYGFALLGIKGAALVPILKGIGTTIMFIGRMLLLNPIGLLITGIAVAALLIYKYWGPIKGFFSRLWDAITERFNRFIKPIKAALSAVGEWFGNSNGGPQLVGAGAGGGMVSVKPVAPIRAGGSSVQHNNYSPSITVNPSPGMNEEELAAKIKREIENDRHTWMARNRSSLRDRE